MAVKQFTLFRYKTGNSSMHRLPAWIKICALPVLSIGAFFLPLPALGAAIALSAFAARKFGFFFREQLSDMRPIVFYIEFLYFLAVFSNILALPDISLFTTAVFIPDRKTITLAIRLVLLIQISSVLFRTTTSLALKAGIAKIERTLRCGIRRIPCFRRIVSADARFALLLSLFLGFIPSVFEAWNRIDRAWRARGGKTGIKKIMVLLPALLSVCFQDAAQKSRAIAARDIQHR